MILRNAYRQGATVAAVTPPMLSLESQPAVDRAERPTIQLVIAEPPPALPGHAYANVLSEILLACTMFDIPHSRFGRKAVGDPRLVGDLKNGRELSPRTKARVLAYIEALKAGWVAHG